MKQLFGRNQVLGKEKEKNERKRRKNKGKREEKTKTNRKKEKNKDGGLNYGLTVWKFPVEYSACLPESTG